MLATELIRPHGFKLGPSLAGAQDVARACHCLAKFTIRDHSAHPYAGAEPNSVQWSDVRKFSRRCRVTAEPTQSPADLDLEVSSRQAFGVAYRRPNQLEARTERVLAGTLRLPPHPDWTGDTADWRANPFNDRNWQFQHHTLRWLSPLRWSGLDGSEAARDEWRRIVRSWYETNLPPRRVAGQFAWKDMADGNRAIELSLGSPLVRSDDEWFVELLRAHVEWLSNKKNLAQKNHALHQHAGLLVVAATVRDQRAMELAYQRMVEQFESTFDIQGSNDEGSVGYHELNLRWWEQAWSRAEAEGLVVPESVTNRLLAGREALAQMMLPDGGLPQIGDTKRGLVGPGLGPQVDYVLTGGKEGAAPQAKAVAYDRGYVISRSGWGESRPLSQESHLILRHGEDLKAHSHQDRGSIHLYTMGRRWLVDSGFHSYQFKDETREHLWSREAHNVALLPELLHDDSAPVELVRFEVTPDAHDFIVIDRGYEGNEWRRRVVYLVGPDCWIVWDEAAKPAKLVQHWHVDIGVTAPRYDRGFELRNEGQSVTMAWLGQLPRLGRHLAQKSGLRGWIGTKWKTLEPGTLITAESSASQGRSVVLIAPSSPYELAVVRSYVTTEGVLTAALMRGPRLWELRVDSAGVNISQLERAWT